MGAWGVRMGENDSAADAVDELVKVLLRNKTKTSKRLIEEAFSAHGSWIVKKNAAYRTSGTWGVLGLAYFLYHHRVRLTKDQRRLVNRSIDLELEVASDWRNPRLRTRALEHFRGLLNGQKERYRKPKAAKLKSPRGSR